MSVVECFKSTKGEGGLNQYLQDLANLILSYFILSYLIVNSAISCPENTVIKNLDQYSPDMQEQIISLWPTRSQNKPNTIQCMSDNNDQLIGYVSTTYVQEVSPLTYDLFIELHQTFRGSGCGRKLFEHAVSMKTQNNATILLTDMTMSDRGPKLYGGENTRKKFDVSIQIGAHNVYQLRKKSGQKDTAGNLRYEHVTEINLWNAVYASNSEQLKHLLKYFEAYPDETGPIKTQKLQDQKMIALKLNNSERVSLLDQLIQKIETEEKKKEQLKLLRKISSPSQCKISPITRAIQTLVKAVQSVLENKTPT